MIYWLKDTRHLLIENYTAKVWILKALRYWGVKKETNYNFMAQTLRKLAH